MPVNNSNVEKLASSLFDSVENVFSVIILDST